MRGATLVVLISLTTACGPAPSEEREPELLSSSISQGLVTCDEHTDTGYRSGTPFTITVVTADGKPVERDTANAYAVMQAAAAADGVDLVVVSGFRTMGEQQVLYACYVNCNCNNCNLAAVPGTSNHQSGHALDLNTSSPGVLNWLNANGARFGFSRTVPSEAWHWEWWGGGPGGGPCGLTRDNCTTDEAGACGNFGCGCVDHQCNGGFCPGTGCTAQHAADCGNFGCGCSDGECRGGTCEGSGCTAKETMDCAGVGCGCVDHQCNGGAACAGTGCTWRETHDCGGFGVNCADHQCAGGYGPGNGCTGKETTDCANQGCGCVDHACGGGACMGTGCTPRQTLDCDMAGQACARGACVPRATETDAGVEPTATPDASVPSAPDASVDAGVPEMNRAAASPDESAPTGLALAPVRGGCSSAPGLPLVVMLAWALRRGRRGVADSQRER